MKKCSKCHQTKPLDQFHKRNTTGTCGVQSQCKVCSLAQVKAYTATRGRYVRIERTYGLTKQQYLGMREAQGNKCAICSKVLREEGTWDHDGAAVDHCHTTGKVRGMLCNNCNRGLGLFKDSQPILQSAIDYLRKTS